MSLRYLVGDVRDRLAEIPDNSIDLIVTSPPFLALRSYLPDEHEHKHLEIGSEPTPAAFLDTMLGLTADWERVLAPHGSICVELGDTFSGSDGGGGDYLEGGMREGQPGFGGSASKQREGNAAHWRAKNRERDSWPLAKSLTGVPTLYTWSLAYGRNLLTGEPSPAGQWRIRNLIVWARPNPPVGALGDKFRPATSYITVATKNPRRYFDLDAVRCATDADGTYRRVGSASSSRGISGGDSGNPEKERPTHNPVGAPPLDWHTDDLDGDWLWRLPTAPYRGAHYACYPLALPKRLIEAMCPLRVCTVCGKPSERIVETEYEPHGERRGEEPKGMRGGAGSTTAHAQHMAHGSATRVVTGSHWTEHEMCHEPDWTDAEKWRTGIVLDPFVGSGTTLEAAQAVGRHGVGIDLDPRNAELARERVGMFLEMSLWD